MPVLHNLDGPFAGVLKFGACFGIPRSLPHFGATHLSDSAATCRVDFELSEPEFAGLWLLVATVRRHLIATTDACEFNIGVNDGVAAGQTVMHAHVHVIPRRKGDVVDLRGGIRW